jgi:rhamnose utilization protein RhaD (predicted bifunctional aldolase and dehydrogenase)
VFDRKLSNVAEALAVADDPTIGALLARSNRLGADRRVTNFAGGNTSAKLALPDPITGEPTRVLAVKGSGGDLGTMTISGLAFLDLVAS